MRKGILQFVVLLLFSVFVHTGVAASLSWDEKEKTFDADVARMELPELLKKISAITGWEVYHEPGISHSASVKFKEVPRGEALRKLLGDLNFEISPQLNSVPKLFVFRTGSANATERISGTEKGKIILGKDNVIANHLIVSLNPDSNIDINVLAQQLGGKVIGKINGVDAYLLEFPDEATATAAKERLRDMEDVASVDRNYLHEQPEPFGLTAVESSSSFNLRPDVTGDGNGIIIGLIDTAVQRLSGNMQDFLLPAVSVTGQSYLNGDGPSHGTTMAESMLHGLNSIVAEGQFSSVRILPVDIYGADANTDTFKVASGIIQAVNGGADIISLSLGGNGDSPFLHRLIRDVSQKNIPIFAAAGNEPVTTPTFPAAYPEVVAVTAAQDRRGTVAPYANRGDFVDVILPGATIVSYGGKNYFVNGTSVSTAIGSGMLAGLAESTRQNPKNVLPTFQSKTAFKPQQP